MTGDCGACTRKDWTPPALSPCHDGIIERTLLSILLVIAFVSAISSCASDSPQPPRIIRFGSNVSDLTVGETVIFSAVVTDPNGVSDLIGGSLLSENGRSYRAFATSGEEGAYELSLSWAEIDQVDELTFDLETVRIFTAEFFDMSGESASESVEIMFHCNGLGYCNGECINLEESVDHCGGCGIACSTSECVEGACVGLTAECFDVCEPESESWWICSTCAEICHERGLECENTCDIGEEYRVGSGYYRDDCNVPVGGGDCLNARIGVVSENPPIISCCCR